MFDCIRPLGASGVQLRGGTIAAMRTVSFAAILVASIAASGCVSGPTRSGQASIPYDIADFQAPDDRRLFVMDRGGRWYLATFAAPCFHLPVQNNIAFRASGTGLFDAGGSILTQYGSCPLASLVRSDRPVEAGRKGVPYPPKR